MDNEMKRLNFFIHTGGHECERPRRLRSHVKRAGNVSHIRRPGNGKRRGRRRW